MGSDTYGLLKNLMAPTKPSTKTFSELVNTLGVHLDPQPTEMGERFRFGRRLQNEGESIASFVVGYDVFPYIVVMEKICQQH